MKVHFVLRLHRFVRANFFFVALVFFAASGAAFADENFETLALELPGYDRPIIADLYKPEGKGPFPLVVFSHGRDGSFDGRAKTNHSIRRSHPDYWLKKGFAIIAPIRPGYGPTGGPDVENSDSCSNHVNFYRTAETAADVTEAVINWAKSQPFVQPKRILLVGQSVGGMTTVALGARHIPGVIGYINFAGGAGGDPDKHPMNSCSPAALGDTYQLYGQTTKIPNLWLYSVNDLFWGAEEPVAWHKAFEAGGGRGTFIQTGPVSDGNGHHLIGKGEAMWMPVVDKFLKSLGY